MKSWTKAENHFLFITKSKYLPFIVRIFASSSNVHRVGFICDSLCRPSSSMEEICTSSNSAKFSTVILFFASEFEESISSSSGFSIFFLLLLYLVLSRFLFRYLHSSFFSSFWSLFPLVSCFSASSSFWGTCESISGFAWTLSLLDVITFPSVDLLFGTFQSVESFSSNLLGIFSSSWDRLIIYGIFH